MPTVLDAPAPPTTGSGERGHSASVAAVAAVAAIAPFDLALPADGWGPLHLRPLMLVVIGVSAWALTRRRTRVLRHAGLLEVAVVCWLAAVWTSAAISEAPLLGAAGAIRLTAFGLLVVATRHTVRTRTDARLVLGALGGGVIVAGAVGLAVWLLGHDVLGTEHLVGSHDRVGARLGRPWSHPNVAGMAIGASLPALLLLGRRAGRVAGVVVVIPALVMTASRGAVVAALASALVIVVVRRRRTDASRLVGLVVLGLAVVSVSPGWAARFADPGTETRTSAAIEAPDRLVLEPGGITTTVTIANIGVRGWPAAGPDRTELAARWVGVGQDWVWGEHRWTLPHEVGPGQSVELAVFVGATIPVGTFDVRWSIVEAGAAAARTPAAAASVGVVRRSAVDPAAVTPTRLAAPPRPLDRLEIWQLAAREFAGAPLLGVGPSELAVAVDDELDEDRAFLGRHAHSLVLEPLSTTGVLGAAPLFLVLTGAVGSAARQALRRRDPLPLAVLAGLVATVVHGLVDWPLVYTSAAIPVAVLTGIAWTWRRPVQPDASGGRPDDAVAHPADALDPRLEHVTGV